MSETLDALSLTAAGLDAEAIDVALTVYFNAPIEVTFPDAGDADADRVDMRRAIAAYLNTAASSPAHKSSFLPVDQAPTNRQLLLKCENGNRRPHNITLVSGYTDPGWKGNEWLDDSGDFLADSGLKPLAWMEMPK